jgi:serine/threonine protein kinase/tetratricopeptide (TPR) repeat protein
MIGETISHYRIIEKLGRGGMGEVYKAEDTRLRRTVALKFLTPGLTLDEDARTRFMHEAQAASALQHHNICTIHEIDRTPDGQMFICMDYYAGDTLKVRIDRGPLRVGEAVDIAAQVAEGLARAHEAGTVHRDIKPANVSVTGDGMVKILDFGLAMLSDRTRITKMDTTVGTVAYMSPENTRGETVGPAADVWSLGVILYEMLTGRLPFRASHDAAMMYTILNEPHAPVTSHREDIPGELARIVDKALSKDPGDRYADAGEMARDLRALDATLDKKVRVVDPVVGPQKWHTRYWLPVAAIAVIAFAILILKPLLFKGEVVSAPRPIAVISFENKTGDPEYDYLREVIPNLLITSLEQSKYLSVVTWERMHDLLAQAGRTDVDLIDRDSGFEACLIDGIDTIVLGSFTRADRVFVTDVKILDVVSKQLLKSASAKGAGVGSILDHQIDELGKEISRGVGLSERKIAAAGARPIADVTTSSMDAYDYFIRGRVALQKYYRTEALRDLEKSVELDSTFAVAWLYLGKAYDFHREINKRDAAFERAKAFAADASEKDRLYIEASYANVIENDEELYHRALIELAAKYPKEKQVYFDLGSHYRNRHMFAEAIEVFGKALLLDPDYGEALNGIAYTYAAEADYDRAIKYFKRYAAAWPNDANPLDSMGEMYFRLGRLDDAIAMYHRALAIKPDFDSRLPLAYVYALKEDWPSAIATMEQYINLTQMQGRKAGGRYVLAYYLTFNYRWRDAIEAIEDTETDFEPMGYKWGLAGCRWMLSWIYYAMGDYGQSLDYIDQAQAIAQAIAQSIDREEMWLQIHEAVLRGLIELKQGRTDRAAAQMPEIEALLPQVDVTFPGDSDMSTYAAALYRTEVLLAEGAIDAAVAAGRSLPHVDIPTMNNRTMFFYNFPPERDVLARAYVQKGAIDDAIEEYEKLTVFRPESEDRWLINPLYHYRLAVLYEQKGKAGQAKQQYEKFLEICGKADPRLEELAEARRRLAALGQ